MLALHKIRRQLVKFRTAQINNLHGLLLEYGEPLRRGRAALDTAMPEVLERLRERLPLGHGTVNKIKLLNNKEFIKIFRTHKIMMR